jgi:hypothetical protein
MESGKNNQPNQTKEFADLNLKDVDSFMNYLAKLLETLQSKVDVLPKVDDKGRSECPFAENLYAQKEEAADKVTEELNKASRYMALLEQEIARLRRNLSQIEGDSSSLHLDQAKEKYLTAKQFQEIHIQKNIQRKKRLSDLIARAEKLLQHARKKMWPGGKPKDRFHPPPLMDREPNSGGVADFQATSSLALSSQRPEIKNEIDNLMSLGPLNR